MFKFSFVCLIIVAISPASLFADDTAAAILHSHGGVSLNGSVAPETAAIFPGDTVRIETNSTARIEVTGATIDLNAETVVQFESDEIHLDHGTVSVNTSRGFKVRAGCVIATPVNMDWTDYKVADTDGKVNVAAIKNDVNIESRGPNPQRMKQSGASSRVTVHEGEQKSREDKCGAGDVKDAIAARGAVLNSPFVQWPARVAIGGGVACVLLCFNDDPISPWKPK